MRSTDPLVFCALLLGALAPLASAHVPQLINYQGRVAVEGVNFDGVGQFMFALVDGTAGGAWGDVLWSNDGKSGDAGGPTAAVTLPVSNGLYSVLLGDTALSNMTVIPIGVFEFADVRLRVWFNDGTHGWQQLAPDQRIAAVGYAMQAHTATIARTVTDGVITSSKIAPGAVGSSHLAAGAVAANLASSGQALVPSGGVILSATANPELEAAGYVRMDGIVVTAGAWRQRSSAMAPSARSNHTVVWTGTEMIVWGGELDGGNYADDGGCYDPETDTWTAISTVDAPSARTGHTAVWTGTEMIIWGGLGAEGALSDGGRYDRQTDTWAPVTTTGAPGYRWLHTAVWTDSEMIIWGGSLGGSGSRDDGKRYRPATNTWTAVTRASAPMGRWSHTAVWTGSEMIVLGGDAASFYGVVDFGSYDPEADAWAYFEGGPQCVAHTAVWTGSEMISWGGHDRNLVYSSEGWRFRGQTINRTGAPSPRGCHTAVWTGSEMIVWGGQDTYRSFDDGGCYAPLTDTWTSLARGNGPTARHRQTAVWTGSEMIIWGGTNGITCFGDTWAYTPGRALFLYQKP